MKALTLASVGLVVTAMALACGGKDSGDDEGEAGAGGTVIGSGGRSGGTSSGGSSSGGRSSGGSSSGGRSSGGSSSGGDSNAGSSSGGASSGGAAGAPPAECPTTEPTAGEACDLQVGTQCTFDSTLCTCVGNWVCQAEDACPPTQPDNGEACSAQAVCQYPEADCGCYGSSWICVGPENPAGCPDQEPSNGDDCGDLATGEICRYGTSSGCACIGGSFLCASAP